MELIIVILMFTVLAIGGGSIASNVSAAHFIGILIAITPFVVLFMCHVFRIVEIDPCILKFVLAFPIGFYFLGLMLYSLISRMFYS